MEPYKELEEQEEIRQEIPDISDLLKEMLEKGASDLHLTTEAPPKICVDGQLQNLPYRDLDPANVKSL